MNRSVVFIFIISIFISILHSSSFIIRNLKSGTGCSIIAP